MAGKACHRQWVVKLCFFINGSLIMRPSVQLSKRICALIWWLEIFPTRVPWSMIDGESMFLITELGTCLESMVSKKLYHKMESKADPLIDNAAIGVFKNPGVRTWDG
jgi:hypothetical protein